MRDLGTIGGSTHALAVAGGTILIGEGTNLLAVDNSDTRHPVIMARTELPGHAYAIRVQGPMAFIKIATYDDGYQQRMALVDIRDVSRPAVRALYETHRMPAVAGTMLYLPSFDGLHIIDAGNLSQPAEVSTFTLWPHLSHAAMLGELLVVADSTSLIVLDVQDPSRPVVVGRISPLAYIADVQIKGSLAYVVGSGQLAVVDLAEPSQPVVLGKVDMSVNPEAVTVEGPTAYVTASRDLSSFTPPTVLQLVDVTSPAAPALRGRYEAPHEIKAVRLLGGVALVAAGQDGLQIVDVSRPEAVAPLGSYQPGPVADLQVAGGLAYLAIDGLGLDVVDLATPAQPAEHGLLRLIGHVSAIQAAGGLALAQDDETLWVLDMQQPRDPRVIASVARSEGPQRMTAAWLEVRGGLAYLGVIRSSEGPNEQCSQWYSLTIIDRFAMAGPEVIGVASSPYGYPGQCPAYPQFALIGDLVLVANETGQAVAFDVHLPDRPERAGMPLVGSGVRELQVDGERLYVRGSDNNVTIWGLDEAGQLEWLGSHSASAPVGGMRAADGMLYVSTASSFEIVDVRNPAAPALISSHEASPASERIAVVSGRAYLSRYTYVAFAGWGHVLTIFDVSDPYHPTLYPAQILARADLAFGDQYAAFASGPRFPTRPNDGRLSVSRLADIPGGEISSRHLSAPPIDIALDGLRIYVAGGAGGLRVYDLPQQTHLPLVAR